MCIATTSCATPDCSVEICPCGTAYSFFTMPFMNMTIALDPESSWQVRHKGKTLKALTGDGLAYFGDHVELSEGGDDFASTIGVGGVVGSNFVWPGAPGKKVVIERRPAGAQHPRTRASGTRGATTAARRVGVNPAKRQRRPPHMRITCNNVNAAASFQYRRSPSLAIAASNAEPASGREHCPLTSERAYAFSQRSPDTPTTAACRSHRSP